MSESSIPQILDELAKATDQFAEARAREEDARREATRCLNALNDAQKRLDAAIAETKKIAPRDSEWHRQQNSARVFPAS